MFFGSFLCFITYWIVRAVSSEQKGETATIPVMAYTIPVLLNFAGNVMSCYSLIFSRVSTYQMLRSSLVLWTGNQKCILARFKRSIYGGTSALSPYHVALYVS
jgi:hypothetical protein